MRNLQNNIRITLKTVLYFMFIENLNSIIHQLFLRYYQYLTNLRLLLYISFSKILSMFDYLVYILSTSVMILFFWNIIILPFLSWKADTFGEKFKIRHSSSNVFRIFEEKLLCPTDLCDLSYFLKWVLGD